MFMSICRKLKICMIIILIFAGIASAGTREIIYNMGVDPRTIDPFLNYALDGGIVDVNIFEGLVRMGLNGKIEPACAESWDVSPDGLTWKFYLRDNLKWSDGEKLTAQNFKDGFMHLINPKTASPYANYGFFIKNAEKFYKGQAKSEEVGLYAPNEKTFIINLEYKNPLMLYSSFLFACLSALQMRYTFQHQIRFYITREGKAIWKPYRFRHETDVCKENQGSRMGSAEAG